MPQLIKMVVDKEALKLFVMAQTLKSRNAIEARKNYQLLADTYDSVDGDIQTIVDELLSIAINKKVTLNGEMIDGELVIGCGEYYIVKNMYGIKMDGEAVALVEREYTPATDAQIEDYMSRLSDENVLKIARALN